MKDSEDQTSHLQSLNASHEREIENLRSIRKDLENQLKKRTKETNKIEIDRKKAEVENRNNESVLKQTENELQGTAKRIEALNREEDTQKTQIQT